MRLKILSQFLEPSRTLTPNFLIGLAALLGVFMCFLGILVNAYRSTSDIKRSSTTNLVSIDHGSTSEKSHLDRLNYAYFTS